MCPTSTFLIIEEDIEKMEVVKFSNLFKSIL